MEILCPQPKSALRARHPCYKFESDSQITIPHAVLQSYNVSGLYHDLFFEFTSNPNPVLDFATWTKLRFWMSGRNIEDVRMGFSLLDTLYPCPTERMVCVCFAGNGRYESPQRISV